MHFRRAADDERHVLAAIAEGLQRRPERHVTYLGVDAPTIAAEMVAEDEDWTATTAVAEDDGIRGWMMASVDDNMGRAWWYGPFVRAGSDAEWAEVVDGLHDHARSLLPTGVDEEELAPDSRFTLLAAWATRHGFHADPGSIVLTLDGELPPPALTTRPATAADTAVADLHDELFRNTHTSGRKLIAGGDATRLRLVAEVDGRLAGYVAVERQPDGDGYIDYLGVVPRLRRHGLGRELVRAGVSALTGLGCRRHHLTVREANSAARSLYTGLGFAAERIIRPYRRGFSLP